MLGYYAAGSEPVNSAQAIRFKFLRTKNKRPGLKGAPVPFLLRVPRQGKRVRGACV
jgi:hypothetical protein